MSLSVSGCIQQFDSTTMFFKNLPDYGETKAGALFPGRHIGFEQFASVFIRHSNAVVDHGNLKKIADLERFDINPAGTVGV